MVGESVGRAIGLPDHLEPTDIIMADVDKPDLKILPFDEVLRPAAEVGLISLTPSVSQTKLSEDDKEIILFQWLATTQRSLEDATPVSPSSSVTITRATNFH